ncbi:hypothetical protein [Thioalkalivibrio sp. XN279]|uniref:hypothetical protein n=1 Tax=Thioalkalivibrio sp. XN279 TaxID=2714953 RepID=UPI001407EC29|nr:hypothetical protein [Thioalkalivibrio sp. XN279]NHA14127.1 hypothetical protein [Thioalkalivibrio sp. XN279]
MTTLKYGIRLSHAWTTAVAALLLAVPVAAAPPGPPALLDGKVEVTNFPLTQDVFVLNEASEAIPVTVAEPIQVDVARPMPVSDSGTWDYAGMSIDTPMIVHDLVFYNDDTKACTFTVSFIADEYTFRTLHMVELEPDESIEFHYIAGFDNESLRFGTTVSDPNDTHCVRNWAALGVEKN